MATLAELESALDAADRAGDTEAAQFFAAEIKAGNFADAATPANTTLDQQPHGAQPPAPLSGSLGIPREMFNLPGPFAPLGVAAGRLLDPEGRRVDVPVPEGAEAAAIGAGRSLTRLGRGILDLGVRAVGADDTVGELQAREAEESALYAPLQAERPGATLAGEVAPYVATAPLGAPAGLLGTMGLGAGLSALEHQPDMAGRARAAAFGAGGGAAGYGLGRVAGRVLGGRASQLDDAPERLAKRGEQLGFRLTPAERSGSRAAGQVEASMSSNPLTSAPFAAIKEANQKTLNRIAAKALGLGDDVERITAEKLGQAATTIGRQFDDALGGQTVMLDDAFAQQLDAIQNFYSSSWGRGNRALKVVSDARKEIAESAGEITAERYKQLQTMLREEGLSAIRSQTGDSTIGRAILAVKDALDDAAARSLSGDKLALFRDAQAKWKVLRQLDTALDTSTGNVSGLKLANTLNRQDVKGFRQGRVGSDLYDAARFARMFASQIGDSGTATRQSLVQLAQTMGIGGAGGVALGTGVDYVDPETGALLGLLAPLLARGGAGLYASKLAQRGLLTPMGRGAQRGLSAGAGGLLAGATGTGSR